MDSTRLRARRRIAYVCVRETNHPGGVTRVAAVPDDGREAVLWEGNEPAAPAPYESVFNAPRGIVAKSIRIYPDTARNRAAKELMPRNWRDRRLASVGNIRIRQQQLHPPR
ncbi:MAG: hypothetical protein N3B01_09300 [Verrucomicrobiae bacterium]|nr:hypothetical protein [Verrucomicrobiae bacterium]